MFQRLLICTDLSDGLQRLVHFVPSLVAANIQHITFLHCVPFIESGAIPRVNEEKVRQAQAQLRVAEDIAPSEINVEVRVESGRPTDWIFKAAKDCNADLLMLGYSLRSALSEKLFGSTTAGIYKQTRLPVLSIRPQLVSTYTTEELDLRCRHIFRHLMVPYDGTIAAKYLIQQIKQRVIQQSQPVLEACQVYWVIDDCDRRHIPYEPFVEQAEKELAIVKADLQALDLKVETAVRLGSPVFEIIQGSLEPDVSAIAVSRNPRNNFLEVSAPSFTENLLRQSWHPILFFPFHE